MKFLPHYRFLILGLLVFLAGCQSTYYSAMEKVGIHKRDIMVSRIEDTQSAQENAREQFRSALEKFRNAVHFDGGHLEDVYSQLNDEYENSVRAAEKVRSRIEGVKSVSDALFDEWKGELDQYTNSRLRRSSEQRLNATRQNYKQMLASLEKSEQQMQPILDAFHDQVLYLKHNLNARAIAALKGEFGNIKTDIEKLLKNMQASIDQSKKFIAMLKEN